MVIEGTTVESTDVDTAGELTKSDRNRQVRQKDATDESSPIPRRGAGASEKLRPSSEGHVLSQPGKWLQVMSLLASSPPIIPSD